MPIRTTVQVFLLGWCTVACFAHRAAVSPNTSPSCIQNPVINVAGVAGVIFPRGTGHVQAAVGQFPQQDWTPTAESIHELEAKLPSYLEHVAPTLAQKAHLYARQYTGFSSYGRRLIFVQLIRYPDPQWLCKPVDVDDGGDNYFSVQYDPESGQFDNLMVNFDAG